MNLFDAIKLLSETSFNDSNLPPALFGAFRRKSISFFNGKTDESTIVYWFQSKSFTIDLRLKHQLHTPLLERQGWIGDTLWNAQTELLSWQVGSNDNFQNHVQWPEPAKLHTVGNCILEFSPSNSYVEDWRQQATSGLYLGLRLQHAIQLSTDNILPMNGGLIICGDYMAYAQSRLPQDQAIVSNLGLLRTAETTDLNTAIESFEVSVSLQNRMVEYSTQAARTHKELVLNDFEVIDGSTLKQHKIIHSDAYELYFTVDTYVQNYHFQTQTETTADSQTWFEQEQNHLAFHSKAVY